MSTVKASGVTGSVMGRIGVANIKDPVRVTISDPNPHDRRARWINERFYLNKNPNKDERFNNHETKTDSGFQELLNNNSHSVNGKPNINRFSPDSDEEKTIPPPQTTGRRGSSKKSIGGGGCGGSLAKSSYSNSRKRRRKLRPGCSLPVGSLQDTLSTSLDAVFTPDGFPCGSSTINSSNILDFEGGGDTTDDQQEPPTYLSRQNCIRYSLSRHPQQSHSQSSISSESEASQEGCENALNPSPNLLIPNGTGVRKQSVLFASYDTWNEDSMAQSFREMSSTIGSVLEASWTGHKDTLEDLLEQNNGALKDQLKEGLLRDNVGRTPLHLAAACAHLECVDLLLEKGGDVNSYDNQKATPLSCAASCGSLPVVETLLAHGADVNAGYDYGKTALHWAVQAGSVDCTKKLLEAGAKQNPPLIFSETPLHIAAALGDTQCLAILLEYKADFSLCKGTNRSTALHLAAEEGNAACLKLLLKAGASHEPKDARGHTALHIAATCDADSVGTLLQAGANPNATDTNGRTPLHCSVSRGSRAAECVRLLVECGADIDAQDNFGYTPLHLAAVNETSQCASILLHHGADVTSKTKAGTSALTLLVRKIPDVMRYLVDRLDAAVTIHDHDPADPDCEIRLDFRAIVPHCEKHHVPGKGKTIQEHSYYQKPRKETEFLTCLLAAGNKKILSHPLSEAFLTLKWQRVRKFFWASLLFQIALVALFTIFVIEVYLIKCPYRRIREHAESIDLRNDVDVQSPFSAGSSAILSVNSTYLQYSGGGNDSLKPVAKRATSASTTGFNWFSVTPKQGKRNRTNVHDHTVPRNPSRTVVTSNGTGSAVPPPGSRSRGFMTGGEAEEDTVQVTAEEIDVEKIHEPECNLGIPLTVVWALLVGFASLMAIKEIFQLLQAPLSYVVSSENWGQWALIGSVTLTAWNTPSLQLSYWQYPAAACGIFLAWGLMLLQVGRFPALGLYVQMLGKVAANFGLFIMAYACLLIAFALAFCVLFPEYPPYSSVPLAILKVLTMMVGEVDYEDLFYNEDNSQDPILYPITAHILHGAFVIIVTIVLMNLLVGLAVHDIQGLQKGAKLNRLSRQTALISRLESFIFSKRLQSCLPRSVGSLLQKSALLVPSSYNWSYYFRPNDPRDKRLPKDLKLASLRLAASKHSSRTIRSHPDARPHFSNSTHQNHPSSAGQIHSNCSEATVRRIELRLDQLQTQMEYVIKALNERMEPTTHSLIVEDRLSQNGSLSKDINKAV